jgi:hypothetical protein
MRKGIKAEIQISTKFQRKHEGFFMSNLINEKKAAEMIGLSVHWLRRKRWSGGGIPYVKVSDGGAVRYRVEEIEAYLNSRSCTSTSAATVKGA